MIPKEMFFVKGVWVHKDKLGSFEMALRKAGIEKYNLILVSSIFPPNCKIVTASKGLTTLQPGQILHCVMAKSETHEPNRLISAAIGFAIPKDKNLYGYLSEHHSHGEKGKVAADYAEDLAASMLASTMGIEFDVDKAWDERKQIYKTKKHIFQTRSICQSAEGDKLGLWTTVLAAAVLVVE